MNSLRAIPAYENQMKACRRNNATKMRLALGFCVAAFRGRAN